MVGIYEWIFTHIGSAKEYYRKLESSKSYKEYIHVAKGLDSFLGNEAWKEVPKETYYDWKLVQKSLAEMKETLKTNDVQGSIRVLLDGPVRGNHAGIENEALYSHTYSGTKGLIEEYYETVVKLIDRVAKSDLDKREKYSFFKRASRLYGTTALCLSGGGAFGYYHRKSVRASLLSHYL